MGLAARLPRRRLRVGRPHTPCTLCVRSRVQAALQQITDPMPTRTYCYWVLLCRRAGEECAQGGAPDLRADGRGFRLSQVPQTLLVAMFINLRRCRAGDRSWPNRVNGLGNNPKP